MRVQSTRWLTSLTCTMRMARVASSSVAEKEATTSEVGMPEMMPSSHELFFSLEVLLNKCNTLFYSIF